MLCSRLWMQMAAEVLTMKNSKLCWGCNIKQRLGKSSKNPKAVLLRQRAQVADAAITATEQAEQAEQAVQEMTRKNLDDAAIQLGMILFKRVSSRSSLTTWSKCRGEHAGELSKKEFREAVRPLGCRACRARKSTRRHV